MKDVPVKIKHNNTWVTTKIGISSIGFVIPPPVNLEVPVTSIIDLAEKRHTLIITYKEKIETIIKIKSVDKVLEIIKKLILRSCTAFRTGAYIRSPALRGGVPVRDAPWEKGSIVVMSTCIWFVTQDRQVCIPIPDVTAIELTKTDVKGALTDAIRIDHVKTGDVITSQVLCPLTTLQELKKVVMEANRGIDIRDGDLDMTDRQVAMLVYSGMDSHTIENMLNIPHSQMDAIYDKIIKLGLAEVVEMQRQVQLTTKGIGYFSRPAKTTKKQAL